MVNRVHKIGRHIGAIKSGFKSLLGKDISKAVNKKGVEMVGSFKKGGKVKRTGLAKVHAGEVVLSKAKVSALKKLLH